MLILSFYIAGLPHRVRDSNLDVSVLAVGDEITFLHDSENPYDPNAVKCIHKRTGSDLGFIPAEQTAIWHEATSKGLEVSAIIHAMPMVKWKELIIRGTVTLP